jgi:cysteinyl-tRNA synthetase
MQRLRNLEKDQSISAEKKSAIFAYADNVLGLELNREVVSAKLPGELVDLLAAREAARTAKNWVESDRLRQELESAGLTIKDSANGQEWQWR